MQKMLENQRLWRSWVFSEEQQADELLKQGTQLSQNVDHPGKLNIVLRFKGV